MPPASGMLDNLDATSDRFRQKLEREGVVLPSAQLPIHTDSPWQNSDSFNTDRHQQDSAIVSSPLVKLSQPLDRDFPFALQVLQQWECIVTDVTADSVWARTHDLTTPDNPREVVEMPFEVFPKADLPLIEAGAAFYWIVGGWTTPGGSYTRTSEIRFKRTPLWSENRIALNSSKATTAFELLFSDGSGNSPTPE